MSLLAKPVVKNKCWIVEEDGLKIGSILANEQGVTLVSGARREKFPSFKLLSDRYNIIVDKSKPQKIPTDTHIVYGYPCDHRPYNILWDIKHRLPIFTKTNKSKSFFCAGYYVVELNGEWTKSYCPKFITLARYPYYGPYKNAQDCEGKLKLINEGTNGITT